MVLKKGLALPGLAVLKITAMKLAQWLKDKGIKKSAFARDIGKTPGAVTGLCDGSFLPSIETLARIKARTDNAVTEIDFLSPAREAAE